MPGPVVRTGTGGSTVSAVVLARRLAAQRLSGPPARSAVDAVGRILAVQGQDFRGARLAVRARSTGLHSSDVHRALTEDRTLLITWLNRGTLHLVRSEDYWWLHALTAPRLAAGNSRRLGQEGVSPAQAERGVVLVERTLAEEGRLVRSHLRDRLAAAGIPVAGQALVHILVLASLRGLIVRGPVVGGEQAYVLVRDWLDKPPPVDRDRALAELARRYLAGHGPATDADLAAWSGLPRRDVRRGLAAIAEDLQNLPGGLVDLAGRPRPQRPPRARLLGPFDPVLHGWASRAPLLGDQASVVTSNGVFRPIALVRGRAVATWAMPGGRVRLAPFRQLAAADAAALDRDARAVEAFLAAP